MDETVMVEVALSREGWGDPQERLDAVMRRMLQGATPGSGLAADALNDYFDSQCSGIPVPDRWHWTGARPEGQFTTGIRAGVLEWARWAGDGRVRVELGSEDICWADCRVYAHRFTVWGYLPYAEMLDIPGLAPDFRP